MDGFHDLVINRNSENLDGFMPLIHPAKFPDEHQGGIHGSGSPGNKLSNGGK